jgi:uncharacterized protein involved in response to NO
VFVAAVLRIVSGLTGSLILLDAGGALWMVGFAGFAFAYAPLLVRRKPAWSEAGC